MSMMLMRSCRNHRSANDTNPSAKETRIRSRVKSQLATLIALSELPEENYSLRSKSGSLAMFAAILLASSFVSNFAADRRLGSRREQALFGAELIEP